MAKRKSASVRRRTARRGRGARAAQRTTRRIKRAGASCILLGVVLAKSNGLPINNALVKIVGGSSNFGRQTHTNAFGLYVMTNLTPERDLIEASKGTKFLEKDKTLTSPFTILNFSI